MGHDRPNKKIIQALVFDQSPQIMFVNAPVILFQETY
jgi:hypothetical protein